MNFNIVINSLHFHCLRKGSSKYVSNFIVYVLLFPCSAGLIRILFSKKEADTVALAMGSKALHLEDVLELLRRQIVVVRKR